MPMRKHYACSMFWLLGICKHACVIEAGREICLPYNSRKDFGMTLAVNLLALQQSCMTCQPQTVVTDAVAVRCMVHVPADCDP